MGRPLTAFARRCALILALLLLALTAAAAPAAAQTRAVRVTSTPSGAMVYVDDKDQPPAGVTPILLKLKPGDHGLIIELEGYTRAVKQVKVPKTKGPAIDVAVTLTPAIGALVISGDAALGATVTIDDAERGKVPLRVELEAGAHHVQVATTPPYEEFVEIKPGDEKLLAVSVEAPPPPPPPVVDLGPARGTPLVVAHVGTEIGWRRFSYSGGGDSPNTQTFKSGAVAAIHLDVEGAPWRLTRKAKVLWPLALVIGGSFAPVTGATLPGEDTSADLYWRTMDLGLRYRLRLLSGKLAVGFEAGWTRDLYQFRGTTDLTIEDRLPDVDYEMVRFGVRAEGHRGPATAWVGVDNRIVVDTGVEGDRFQSADVSARSVRLGALYRLLANRLEVGVEYSLQHMGWDTTPFPPPNPNRPADYPATGASDTFHGLQLWVGSHY
ncbi:MAG TPA: PEGA domain-containing protein [Kofleriaceae bacterium]|nr:PEGA domain-containing protein [Kofleriaceae bacterium]